MAVFQKLGTYESADVRFTPKSGFAMHSPSPLCEVDQFISLIPVSSLKKQRHIPDE